MELLFKILPFISTVAGVFLGWVFGQYSQWNKNVKDDNRIRKEVIFYLLELRYLLMATDTKPLLNFVVKYMKDRIPVTAIDAGFDNMMIAGLKPVAVQMNGQLFETRFPKIREGFAVVIAKLSSVDPLLAFELSGRDDAIRIGDHFAMLIRALPADQDFQSQLPAFTLLYDALESASFVKVKTALEELTLELGGKIGFWFKRTITKEFKRSNDEANHLDDQKLKFLDEHLGGLLSSFGDSMG